MLVTSIAIGMLKKFKCKEERKTTMKNTTMKEAVVMVKEWAENRKGYGMELSDCFWDLDTLLVEEYGMCGEWYGSNETEPTPNQYRKLKDIIAEVYGYKR